MSIERKDLKIVALQIKEIFKEPFLTNTKIVKTTINLHENLKNTNVAL